MSTATGQALLPGTEQLQATTVVEAAVSRLRTLLFRGDLAAGQQLRDTTLATELGIARPTVRAAVQQLVSEGLLLRDRGQSARVRSFEPEDVADLYRARRVLEVDAVRTIIERGLDVGAVHRELTRFSQSGGDWAAAADADVAFHSAVVATAGSARLSAMFTTLSSEMRLLIAQLKPRYTDVPELLLEHEVLLEALKAGQVDRAVSAWEHHLTDAATFLAAPTPEDLP